MKIGIDIDNVLSNFNDELLEFFEWEDNDDIKYIKRLPLIRVEDSLIKDVLENDILFDDLLLDQIKLIISQKLKGLLII